MCRSRLIPIDPAVKSASSVTQMTTDAAPQATERFASVQSVRDSLREVGYLADDGIAGVAFLADKLGKPILVEPPRTRGPCPGGAATAPPHPPN